MSAGKSEVVRHEPHLADPKDDRTPWAMMITARNGRYILHSDYAALESLLLDARAEVERLRIEVDGLTAQNERMMAYTINHNGKAWFCSSAMRDAYSEEHHARLRAEALAGEYEKDARTDNGVDS